MAISSPVTPGLMSVVLGIVPVIVAWLYSEYLHYAKYSVSAKARHSDVNLVEIAKDFVKEDDKALLIEDGGGLQSTSPRAKALSTHSPLIRSGVPDGQPKLLLSLIPDYPLLNFMLTTSIYVAISYRLFELTNTLKTAFIPTKDDKRLVYNTIAALVICTCLYFFSFVLITIPQKLV